MSSGQTSDAAISICFLAPVVKEIAALPAVARNDKVGITPFTVIQEEIFILKGNEAIWWFLPAPACNISFNC